MRPSRDEILTVDSVPSAPNGTATIYRVASDPHHNQIVLATIDEEGVIRALDGERGFFYSDTCEIVEVVQ